MEELKTKKTPTEKAWDFFRKLINDDEKFHTIKNLGEPIEIRGSSGGRYFLYPDAAVVRLGKKQAKLGHATGGRRLPKPDVLATIFVWITQKEEDFKKKWGCGNIDVAYQVGSEEKEEDLEELQARVVLTAYKSDGPDLKILYPLFALVAIAVMLVLSPLTGMFAGQEVTAESAVLEASDTILSISPILAAAGMLILLFGLAVEFSKL